MKQPTENQLKKFENVPLVSMWIPHGYMRDLMDYERCSFFIGDRYIDYRFIFFQPPTENLQNWVRREYVHPGYNEPHDKVRLHVSSLIEVRLPWKHYEIIRNSCYGAMLRYELKDEEHEDRVYEKREAFFKKIGDEGKQEYFKITKELNFIKEEKERSSYNPNKNYRHL